VEKCNETLVDDSMKKVVFIGVLDIAGFEIFDVSKFSIFVDYKSMNKSTEQKVHTYCMFLEFHSVCPLVRIGTPPTPSPPSKCVPPKPKGGTDSPAGEGWGGSQFGRLESLALCLLCVTEQSSLRQYSKTEM
jgi:hypothetical protein